MRNAVQRRNHRERAQPLERSKWGLLEKHRDYSLRAADHKAKRRKLSALRQKAADRNEDEFYFAMISTGTEGGIKRGKKVQDNGGGKVLGRDVVRLMKTQDAGYLRTVLQATKYDRERVEQGLTVAELGVNVGVPTARSRRIVFGDGDEEDSLEAPHRPGEDEELENTLPDEYEGDASQTRPNTSPETGKDLKYTFGKRNALAGKRRQLETLHYRERQLSAALQEVEDQRARVNGTVGGGNKRGVKFKARHR